MFEKYTKNGKREIPIASVSVLGRLALNQTSIVNFGIEEAKYATMFFDKEKNLIGIRFSNQKEKSSFKIQWRENSGLFLTVKNFFEAYSIDFSQTYFCDVTQDEKDKSFIIVDLKTRRERR